MDIRDAVKGRRSIREYSDKAVSLEDVAEILEVARFSPSSGNMQNWKVIVVTDPEVRNKLAEVSAKQDWMGKAPVHLVICNDYSQVVGMFKKLGKMFSIQNCAIFATNVMNLAYAKGFGTCWVGSFPVDSVKKVLDIPDEGIDPEIILTLGYPAEEKLEEQRRISIFDFSFFNKWGKKEELVPKSPGFLSKIFGK